MTVKKSKAKNEERDEQAAKDGPRKKRTNASRSNPRRRHALGFHAELTFDAEEVVTFDASLTVPSLDGERADVVFDVLREVGVPLWQAHMRRMGIEVNIAPPGEHHPECPKNPANAPERTGVPGDPHFCPAEGVTLGDGIVCDLRPGEGVAPGRRRLCSLVPAHLGQHDWMTEAERVALAIRIRAAEAAEAVGAAASQKAAG